MKRNSRCLAIGAMMPVYNNRGIRHRVLDMVSAPDFRTSART